MSNHDLKREITMLRYLAFAFLLLIVIKIIIHSTYNL